MHEESFEADTLDLVHRILFMVSRCLTTAFFKTYQPVCFLYMPARGRLEVLEATKAYQREQQRLRTERRLTELRQDQRELELREVLTLFSLIWLLGIVLFYARLYLGPLT